MKEIRILRVEPGKNPEVIEIENTLEELQAQVGGDIQDVYPFEDEVCLICNEEGKIQNLPLNRLLRGPDGVPYDIIAGTFLISGLTEDDFGSLPDELIRKYTEMFRIPEIFVRAGEKSKAAPAGKEG